MKKYYRRHRLSILAPTRNERIIGGLLINIIRMTACVITETVKGFYEISIYIPKLIKNFHVAYKNGYNLNEIENKLNHLTPRQFEILMAEVFKCQGFDEVILTKFNHDYGRDIILKKKINGIIETTYVECKYYDYKYGFQIGRDICFKLLGSMQMFNADKGIIISTGKFHRNSFEVANSVNNLELMDKNDIKNMLYKLDSEQIQKVMFKLNNAS